MKEEKLTNNRNHLMNKQAVIEAIKNHIPESLEETSHSAAVLVLLIEDSQENLFFLLTKRASTLANYAGDYSFPGGMRDGSDADFQATAQRETFEELNVSPSYYEMIGQLDDFNDRYGNLVRPYVATMTAKVFEAHYKKASDEVDKVYYFPLCDINAIETDPNLELLTKRKPSYLYHHDDVTVWGLTASILVLLGNIIFRLSKPVGRRRIGK